MKTVELQHIINFLLGVSCLLLSLGISMSQKEINQLKANIQQLEMKPSSNEATCSHPVDWEDFQEMKNENR